MFGICNERIFFGMIFFALFELLYELKFILFEEKSFLILIFTSICKNDIFVCNNLVFFVYYD